MASSDFMEKFATKAFIIWNWISVSLEYQQEPIEIAMQLIFSLKRNNQNFAIDFPISEKQISRVP